METPQPLVYFDLTDSSSQVTADFFRKIVQIRTAGAKVIEVHSHSDDLRQFINRLTPGTVVPAEQFPFPIILTGFASGDLEGNEFWMPYAAEIEDDTTCYFYLAKEEGNEYYIAIAVSTLDIDELFLHDSVGSTMLCLTQAAGTDNTFGVLLPPSDDMVSPRIILRVNINGVVKYADAFATNYSPLKSVLIGVREYSHCSWAKLEFSQQGPAVDSYVAMMDVVDGAYMDDIVVAGEDQYDSLEALYAEHPECFESSDVGLSATRKHFIRIS